MEEVEDFKWYCDGIPVAGYFIHFDRMIKELEKKGIDREDVIYKIISYNFKDKDHKLFLVYHNLWFMAFLSAPILISVYYSLK
jgi:hypothetical protein